jgi:hypothetical protein
MLPMPRFCLTLTALLLLLMLSGASGALITWISTKDHDWGNKTNWSPERVPGAHDDVVISSGAWVNLSTPAAVKSILLGGSNSSCFLQAQADLHVMDTLSVEPGSRLDLIPSSWIRLIVGQANIAGQFNVLYHQAQLTGSFFFSGPVQFDSTTVVVSDSRFNFSGPVTFVDTVVFLNRSSVVSIGSVDVIGALTVQAQMDDTDAVFDTTGGFFNLFDEATFVVQAPVVLGAFMGGTIGSSCPVAWNITQGSLILTNTASFYGGLTVIDVGEFGRITVELGATLSVNSQSFVTGHARSAEIVNNGFINVTDDDWGPAQFQNISLTGNGSVAVSKVGFVLYRCNFSQHSVTLSGGGVFKGCNETDITKLDAVIGAPVVEATIGSNSYTCPEQCDNIRTKSDFRFSIEET